MDVDDLLRHDETRKQGERLAFDSLVAHVRKACRTYEGAGEFNRRRGNASADLDAAIETASWAYHQAMLAAVDRYRADHVAKREARGKVAVVLANVPYTHPPESRDEELIDLFDSTVIRHVERECRDEDPVRRVEWLDKGTRFRVVRDGEGRQEVEVYDPDEWFVA